MLGRSKGAGFAALVTLAGLPFASLAVGIGPASAAGPVAGWNSVSAAPSNNSAIACIPADGDCWAAGGTAGVGQLDKSTDGGQTWTSVSASLPASTGVLQSISCTEVSATDDCWAIAPVSGSTTVVYSIAGAAWSQVSSPPGTLTGTSEISCVPATTDCFATESGPAVIVTTNGSTWSASGAMPSSPVTITSLSGISCPTSSDCSALGSDGAGNQAVIATTNGGTTWSEQSLPYNPAATDYVSIACPTSAVCFVAGSSAGGTEPAIATTTDSGAQWIAQQVPQRASNVTPTAISCFSATSCLAVGSGTWDEVLATADGQTWYQQDDRLPAGATGLIGATAASCVSATVCAIVGATGVDDTTDFGEVAPAAPASVTATAGNGEATVAWSPSAPDQCDPGGSCSSQGPVGSYAIVPSPACASCTGLSAGSAGYSVVGGLTNGTSYQFTVQADAVNGASPGSPSGKSAAVSPNPAPVTGSTTWTSVVQSQSLVEVACPTTTQCIGVGQVNPGSPGAAGSVETSSNGGASWSAASVPAGVTSLDGVGCIPASVSTCFAVGYLLDPTSGHSSGVLLESSSSGSTWSSVSVPAGLALLSSVSCFSSTQCVVAGQYSSGAGGILTTQDGGSTWTAPVLPDGSTSLASVSCTTTSGPLDTCVAVGAASTAPVILTSADGGYLWSMVAAASLPTSVTPGEGLTSVSCPTVPDCYAVGPGYSGGTGDEVLASADAGATWTAVALPGSPVSTTTAISCVESSGDVCLATGQGGSVFVLSSGSWSAGTAVVDTNVTSISCANASACAVVGSSVAASGASEPAAFYTTGGGSSWTSGMSGLTPGEAAVACGGTSTCVAVGSPYGAEMSSSGGASWTQASVPAGVSSLSAASCPSSSVCFAAGKAGGNGSLLTSSSSGASWSSQSVPSGVTDISGIACPTASQCVAVGAAGASPAIVTTSNGGSVWTGQTVPAGVSALESVTCVSTSDCFAAGTAGGEGALVVTTDGGTTWSLKTDASSTSFTSVSCADSSDCITVGSSGVNALLQVTIDGGTSWTSAPLPSGIASAVLQSAFCLSTSSCLVGGSVKEGSDPDGNEVDQGFFLTSFDPFATGGGSWVLSLAPTTSGGVDGISCPSATSCTAADGGIIYSSSAGVSLPGAPTIGTATVSGTTATLTWTAPSSNGGGAITGYVITPSPACATCSGLNVGPGVTSASIPGLAVGSSYSFTVAAQNAAGLGPPSAPSNSVTASAVVITTTSLPKGTVSVAYSQTLAATGGTTPYAWSIVANSGSLPPGLSLSSTGVIAGTPTGSGTFSFTVQVSDSASPANTATQALSIAIPLTNLSVVTTSLPDSVLTKAYSQSLAAQGGTPPYSWTVPSGALPAGLSMSSAGLITGTPTAAIGSYSVIFQVTDSSSPKQSAQATLTINVDSNTLLTLSGLLPNAQAGVAYEFQLPIQGGIAPYNWVLVTGTLPPGLVLSQSGIISGVPAIPLTADFTLGIVDSESPTPAAATADYAIIVTPAPTTQAYWEFASDGGVFTFADRSQAWSPGFHGSMGGKHLNAPIVGGAPTPDGLGYWEVASDGGVFTFGDAHFFGSMGGKQLAGPVVGIAPTPDGAGYWLVASDGGIFSFGDALFLGSRGGYPYAPRMVAMASTPDGLGYWLVASDGAVFTFGDAGFFGSAGSIHIQAPVVGFSPTADGLGYWLVSADGGVYAYGDAPFKGSLGGSRLASPAVGITGTLDGGGYWIATADGRIFAFGDATYQGSMGGIVLSSPVIGVAAP